MEIGNFILVCSTATITGIYCYAVWKSTKAGPLTRLLLLLPDAAALTALPLTLSSFHLGGAAAFSLTWLANFKLLLLSFDTGPLSRRAADSSLPHFLITLLLPVKFSTGPARPGPSSVVRWAKAAKFGGKVLCFGVLVVPYSYKEELPVVMLLALYGAHCYLVLELGLAATSALARAGIRLDRELAPQFNEPYLSTSLQDFWGRRWNLIASDILKQTIHSRIRSHGTPLIGKQGAIYVGIFATFLFSGIMHELMYYCITRVSTEWAIIPFFVFHGVCMIVEVMLKTTVSARWQLHRAILTPLMLGFLWISAVWLFFPLLLRKEVIEKVIVEYLVVANYIKRNIVFVMAWE